MQRLRTVAAHKAQKWAASRDSWFENTVMIVRRHIQFWKALVEPREESLPPEVSAPVSNLSLFIHLQASLLLLTLIIFTLML